MHSAWLRSTFLGVLKFLQIKLWDLISGGNQFCRKSEVFAHPPSCIRILKVLRTEFFLSLVRFQGILLDSRIAFSDFWKFLQIEKGDLISGGNQFCRKSVLFDPPFSTSLLKVLWTQILCHLLELRKKVFSDFWNFYKLKRGGLISGGTNSEESLIYLVPHSVFQF